MARSSTLGTALAARVMRGVIERSAAERTLHGWVVFGALLVGAVFFVSLSARGAEQGALTADGILKVKGMSVKGARMVMVDRLGTSLVMESGLDHFTLSLDLNSEYLLEFTREGCVTKQLLFETHVPTGNASLEAFEFRFEVTLQPPPPGQVFEYAGPVGRIYFDAGKDGFNYDHDYHAKASPELNNAMVEAREGRSRRHAPEWKATVINTPPPAESLRTDEAPLVHLTGTPDPATMVRREHAAFVMNVREPEVERTTFTRRPVRPAVISGPLTAATRESNVLDVPVVVEAVPPPIRTTSTIADDVFREEELYVEKLRVTKVVRIIDHGHPTEFRRVEHSYGTVYHFLNGQPCTEAVYERGVTGK